MVSWYIEGMLLPFKSETQVGGSLDLVIYLVLGLMWLIMGVIGDSG